MASHVYDLLVAAVALCLILDKVAAFRLRQAKPDDTPVAPVATASLPPSTSTSSAASETSRESSTDRSVNSEPVEVPDVVGKRKNKSKGKAEKAALSEEQKRKDAEDQKRGYKEVEEAWKDGMYKEVQKPKPDDDASKKLLFIIRVRHGTGHRHRGGGSSSSTPEPVTYIQVQSPHLLAVLRKLLKHNEEIFAEVPLVQAKAVFLIREDLEKYRDEIKSRSDEPEEALKSTDELSKDDEASDDEAESKLSKEDREARSREIGILLSWLEKSFSSTLSQLNQLLPKQQISYSLLWYPFRRGVEAYISHPSTGEPLGITITYNDYVDRSDGSSLFRIDGSYWLWNGKKYQKTYTVVQVERFTGTAPMTSLPIELLTEKVRGELKERGKKLVGLAGVKYVQYDSHLVQTVPCSLGGYTYVKQHAPGRVMVDVKAFRRLRSSSTAYRFTDDDENEEDEDSGEISSGSYTAAMPDEDLWQLPPALHGFSFVLKQWGELLVEHCSPIEFDGQAFEHLVLPAEQKRLIKGLVEATKVENKGSLVKDILSHKGGGCVFCLHGSPGSGKTLTAESVAEHLQRPLYVVSSGELGMTAETVAKGLREALDLCESWNAVALIDEADVYLEERSMHELQRNSLVSIFLQVLDSHQALLFLTTNRVKSFDPAFVSRFNVALKFPNLDKKARSAIWRRFLTDAGVQVESAPKTVDDAGKAVTNGFAHPHGSDDDAAVSTPSEKAAVCYVTRKELDRLASKPFNGRTIRNIVRTSHSIALSEGVPLALSHVNSVVDVSEAFNKDFQEYDVEATYAAKGEGFDDQNRMFF